MLTLQGILSFIMMFGIFGLPSSANDNTLMAIGAGTVAGLISMYIMGKVYHLFRGLNPKETSTTPMPWVPVARCT